MEAWLDGATALETLDDRRRRQGRRPTSPASRPSSSAAGCRTGSPRSAAAASAATRWSSSRTPPGRAERTIELLADYDVFAVPIERAEDAHTASVLVGTGHLSRGFRLPDAALQIWAETDVFEEERKVHERRRSATRTFLSDFRDLKVGDLVVHVDHGIGVFVGLKRIDVGFEPQEFMELRYAGEDKLFVPVERLDLVQKYTGAARPSLDKLGGTTWEKAKTRVKKAMRDMAEELLKLYAARKAIQGHAFSPDSHWQQEFEDAFEWELTPDQQTAIADIKGDMETPTSMDRLLCGDVGYGKTEVAMRAAFKAVMDGKQVAFLAPTTVLAFQHLKTLQRSLRRVPGPHRHGQPLPHRRRNRKQIVDDLQAGKVEIIVGTHRLLSKDVQFRDLGLLVVDEEQRFGVAHKERIKQMRKRVDVLTMTATPIPRTLNMSLAGIRDMSIIETPPKDRLSIQTNVVKFDQPVITRAIRTEIERGGQIYFVHNRVESIYSLGNLLTRLVPEARIAVAHGQMSEEELERVMVDFVAHKYDVLLATTIIENGLDISNANTIIVNRADRYGLSQLYQLRGRVGRSDRRAYAYLLIPPEDSLSPVAKKRLAAIREFSDLGSGFRVAALDLEIRGAGNLLGGEQSGHIEAVGFDMYMKLLEQTIKELKGRGDRRRDPRQRQSARRSPSRRGLHPGHEPASDGIPAHGGGPHCAGAGQADGRSARPIWRAAGVRAESRRIRVDPPARRPPARRVRRPGGPAGRPKVQARREARPDLAVQSGPVTGRCGAAPAGDSQARSPRPGQPEASRAPGRRSGGRSEGQVGDAARATRGQRRRRFLVDDAGAGRRGGSRVQPRGDHAAGQGRPARGGRHLRPGRGIAARIELRRVDRLTYSHPAS